MHDELKEKMEMFRMQLAEMKDYLDIDTKRRELDQLEAAAAEPEFWNDQNKAQANIAAAKSLKLVLDPFDAIFAGLDDTASGTVPAASRGVSTVGAAPLPPTHHADCSPNLS